MSEQPGFLIYKKHYPIPERYRLEDPVLVRLVTGMEWPEFVRAISTMDPAEPDQVALAGLIAVAFWQGNPQMRRNRVAELMERMPLDEIEMVGGDEEDGEGDAGPPDVPGESLNSPTTTSASSPEAPAVTTEASVSEETTETSSGSPGSDITSPA